MEWNAIVINGAQMIIPVGLFVLGKLAYDGAKLKSEPSKKNDVCHTLADLTKISTENSILLISIEKSLDKAQSDRDLLFKKIDQQTDVVGHHAERLASLEATIS